MALLDKKLIIGQRLLSVGTTAGFGVDLLEHFYSLYNSNHPIPLKDNRVVRPYDYSCDFSAT
jgi:hypothetical protein